MPKCGVLHDYDLMANQESSAENQTCIICESSPMMFQWSDYSGQAMCMKCGCPYQLKWGNKEQEAEGNYPYLSLKADFVPIFKQYWEEKREFACLGQMISGPLPGYQRLVNWLRKNYPEWVKSE